MNIADNFENDLNWIVNCNIILIISTSYDELAEYYETITKYDSWQLKIGKKNLDDVVNFLFINEPLRNRVLLISTDSSVANGLNYYPLMDHSNKLLKRILAEQGTVIDKDHGVLVSLIKRHIIKIFVSVKLFFLHNKFKKKLKK